MIKKINLKNKAIITRSRAINVLEFDAEDLYIQREGDDEIGIYFITYDEDPFYLVIDGLKGYFECNYGNKYLTLMFDDKNLKAIYTRIWDKIKFVINEFADNKLSNYNKDYGTIKFESNNNLPLGCVVKIHCVIMILKSVIQIDNRFYPQIYLDYCSYEI